MNKAKKRKLNNVVVFIMLIALLVTPIMAMAEGEYLRGSDEIIVENEIVVEEVVVEEVVVEEVVVEEVVIEGEIEIDPIFYIPPPPMPGEEEEDPPEELFLTVSPDTWNPGPEASSITIFVTSNDNWGGIFPEVGDWLTIPLEGVGSQVGDGSFEIHVTENTSTQPRTTRVSIGGMGGTPANRGIITVTQQGAQEAPEDFLNLSTEYWNLGYEELSTFINVEANVSWTATSNDSTWLLVFPESGEGNGTLELTASANEGEVARTGTITVTGGGITHNITVNQQGRAVEGPSPSLALSEEEWMFTAAAESADIFVVANVPWSEPTVTTEDGEGWLTVNNVDIGEDFSGSFRINVEANTGSQRRGIITVTAGGITATVTVTQRPAQGPVLIVSPLSWEAAQGGDETSKTVTANVPWTATSNHPWLSVSPETGHRDGTLQVVAEPNDGTSTRNGSITVTGGGITHTIRVTQPAADLESPTLTLSTNTWEAGSIFDRTTIQVTTNATWEFPTVCKEGEDWVVIQFVYPEDRRGNGSFEIIAWLPNPYDEIRTGIVTVTAEGLTETVEVRQAPGSSPQLFLAGNEWTTSANPESRYFTLFANVPWTATSSDESWLTVEENRDDGFYWIRVQVTENTGGERRGTITVSGGGLTDELTVIQKDEDAPRLTLLRNWITTDPEPSNYFIHVEANVPWTALSNDEEWLTVHESSYPNASYFEVRVTLNTGSPRTGTITVSGGGFTKEVTVNQRALNRPYLEVSTDFMEFTAPGGYQRRIRVTSNVPWTVTSSDETWLEVVYPNTGNGNGYFFIRATRAIEQRQGVITVEGGGMTRQIRVSQAPPILTLSTNAWNPGWLESYITVRVTTNTYWEITSDVSWLRISNLSSAFPDMLGSGSFKLTAETNTQQERLGIITVRGEGVTQRIYVTQQPAGRSTLEVSPNHWNALAYGGFIRINVSSNITWEVTSDYDWLMVFQGRGSGNGFFEIEVRRNEGSNRPGRVVVRGTGPMGQGVYQIIEVNQYGTHTPPTLTDSWHGTGDRVGFFPGDINVYATTLGWTTSAFQDYFYSSVEEARNIWSDAIGVPIGVSSSLGDAQIQVFGGSRRLMEIELGYEPGASTWAGIAETNKYWIGSAVVNGQNVMVLEMTSSRIFIVEVSMYPELHNRAFYRFVILHEMGHAVGWLGHSTNPNEIMYAYAYNWKEVNQYLSPEEKRHIRTVYDHFR